MKSLFFFSLVRHCVDLFLDFVTIFRKLMIILAMNDKVPSIQDLNLLNK